MEINNLEIQEKCNKMIDMLKKRDSERKADIEKDKKERSNLTAENEKIDFFRSTFAEKCEEINEDLCKAETVSISELADYFNEISKKILTLQKYVATSNIFLTTYNKRICQLKMQELTNKLKELEEKFMPKKKFGFKNKNRQEGMNNGYKRDELKHNGFAENDIKGSLILGQNLNGSCKSEWILNEKSNKEKLIGGYIDNTTEKLALQINKDKINEYKEKEKLLNDYTEKEKITSNIDSKQKINYITETREHDLHNKENNPALLNGHSIDKIQILNANEKDEVDYVKKKILNENFCGFQNRIGEIIVLQRGEILKKDVTLSNLENCTAKIFGSPSTLHISNVKNSYIFCGPVSTSIFVENCENCTFVIACQQLRLHSSTDINIYLHVTSRAIIEDCSKILFAPYNLKYDGIDSDFIQSGLDKSKNHWNDVDDFNWLNVQHSPNWGLIEETKIMGSWDHMFSPT